MVAAGTCIRPVGFATTSKQATGPTVLFRQRFDLDRFMAASLVIRLKTYPTQTFTRLMAAIANVVPRNNAVRLKRLVDAIFSAFVGLALDEFTVGYGVSMPCGLAGYKGMKLIFK